MCCCRSPAACVKPTRPWRSGWTKHLCGRLSHSCPTTGWREPATTTGNSCGSGCNRRARSSRRRRVRTTFDYALIRVVPRPERGELINAGVILYCRGRDFLEARIALDRVRLQALDPSLDLSEIERALAVFPEVCAGGGPIGRLDLAERFHWLVAPRS